MFTRHSVILIEDMTGLSFGQNYNNTSHFFALHFTLSGLILNVLYISVLVCDWRGWGIIIMECVKCSALAKQVYEDNIVLEQLQVETMNISLLIFYMRYNGIGSVMYVSLHGLILR